MQEKMKKENEREMEAMKYLANKYPAELTVFGQFAYDVQQGEKLTNKEIAHSLHKMGYIDAQGLPVIKNFKFLEKVSILS
jgi:hypothetical protein